MPLIGAQDLSQGNLNAVVDTKLQIGPGSGIDLSFAQKPDATDADRAVAEFLNRVPEPPSSLEVWGAAALTENMFGAAIGTSGIAPDVPIHPHQKAKSLRLIPKDWDLLEEVDPEFHDNLEPFMYLHNTNQVKQMQQLLRFQRQQKEVLAKGGLQGMIAAGVMGAADLTLLIPGKVAVAPAMAIIRGGKVASSIGRGALVGGGAVSGQEAVLQSYDIERSALQSGANVAGGVILGGLFSGAAAGLTKRAATKHKLGKEVKKNFREEIREEVIKAYKGGSEEADFKAVLKKYDKLGDKEKAILTKNELESFAGLHDGVVKYAGGAVELIRSPRAILGSSSFGEAKQFSAAMFDRTLVQRKNLADIDIETKASLEEKLQLSDASVLNYRRKYRDTYTDDIMQVGKGSFGRPLVAKAKAKLQGKASIAEIEEQVHKALLNGDVHADGNVTKMAKMTRDFVNPVFERAVELGILGKSDLKTSMTHWMRRYKVDRIVTRRQEFEQILRDEFKAANPNKSNSAIAASAKDVTSKIIREGNELGSLSKAVQAAGTGKVTAPRTLDVPDSVLFDFLEHDIGSQAQQYVAQLNRLISEKEYYIGTGVDNFDGLIRKLQAEKDTLTELATSDAKKLKIKDEFNMNVEVMKTVMASIRGSIRTGDGKLGKANRMWRQLNQIMLLPNVTRTSLTEMAAVPFRQGITRTLLDGYLPFVKSIRSANLANDQLQDLMIGTQHEMSDLMRLMTDADFTVRPITTLEKVFDATTAANSRATGIIYWTNIGERVAGRTFQGGTLRTLKKWKETGKISSKDKRQLNQMGINVKDYDDMLTMFKHYGEELSGSFIPNLHNWKGGVGHITPKRGEELGEIFSLATIGTVRNTILRPGRGDIPLVGQTSELGKTLLQLKSFGAKASSAYTLRAGQEIGRFGNVDQAFALMYLVGLGMAVGELTRTMNDQKDSDFAPETLDEYILDGIQRSGVMTLSGDMAINFAEGMKMGPGYGRDRMVSALLGPSASQVNLMFDIVAGVADGDLSETDMKRAKRMMGPMNIFYMNELMKQINGE